MVTVLRDVSHDCDNRWGIRKLLRVMQNLATLMHPAKGFRVDIPYSALALPAAWHVTSFSDGCIKLI